MDRLEMAEALRQKAGVTYEEARQALEQGRWDMLEAMVILENSGKLRNRGSRENREESKMDDAKTQTGRQKAESWVTKVFSWIKDAVDAGNRSHFIIKKEGRQVLEVPVTVAVLLLVLLHGLFMLLFFISLIIGYRYSFRGEKENAAYQQDLREAKEAAEEINQRHTVNSFREGT